MQLESTQIVEITSVHEISIHQSPYYDICYKIPGSEQELSMRINPEAFYPNPQLGDTIETVSLMGNIMSAKKIN